MLYKVIRERCYCCFTVYYDRNFRLKITNNIRRCVWDRAWRQSLSTFFDPHQLLTCFRVSISTLPITMVYLCAHSNCLHHGHNTKSESFASCRGRVNSSGGSEKAWINMKYNMDSLSVSVPWKLKVFTGLRDSFYSSVTIMMIGFVLENRRIRDKYDQK